MNLKQAKRLRRRAEELAAPGVGRRLYDRDNISGSRILVPECVRAIYRRLKKEHRHGARSQ